jgi:photosystem II stability/assembly factor-like uncharacterized protein
MRTVDGGINWRIERLPTGVGELDGVSCSGTSDCWAVGANQIAGTGVVVATTDAGKHWSTQRVPKRLGNLAGISCASPSDCWATAGGGASGGHGAGSGGVAGPPTGEILATTNGGRHWSSEALPSAMGPVLGVSCPGTSDCWAVASTSNDVVILARGASLPGVITGGHRHLGAGRRT